MFTSEEYTEMMIINGESGSNSKAVARLYRERFPHGQYPSSDIFLETIYLDEQDCVGKLVVHNLNIYFENLLFV
jgi:hypothetical protein